jgi:hypothetical protein
MFWVGDVEAELNENAKKLAHGVVLRVLPVTKVYQSQLYRPDELYSFVLVILAKR